MSHLTRLERPASSSSTVSIQQADADDFTFPSLRYLNKSARLRLSASSFSPDANYSYKLFAVGNVRGWCASITRAADGNFGISLSRLPAFRSAAQGSTSDSTVFVPERTLQVPSEPHFLTFACADTRLVVGCKDGAVLLYDAISATALQTLSTGGSPARQILANPNFSDPELAPLVAVLRMNGEVEMYNATSGESQGGWTPVNAVVTTASWSPKGKQLALGFDSGDIVTFELNQKASFTKHIPSTLADGKMLYALTWLSPGYAFRAVYRSTDLSNPNAAQHLVYMDKQGMLTAIELTHPYPLPDRPSAPTSFGLTLPKWRDDEQLLITIDSSSSDLEMSGGASRKWYQHFPDNPVSLPMDKETGDDTILLGVDIDATYDESTEETARVPVLYAYLNDGTIHAWTVEGNPPYTGLVTTAESASIPTSQPVAAVSPPAPSAFSQSSAPPQSAFGQTSSSGQKPSPFGSQPAFGQTGFGNAAGAAKFGQSSFGQATEPSKPVVSGGFGAFANQPTSFGSSEPPKSGGFGAFAGQTSSFGSNATPSQSSFGTGGAFSSAAAAMPSAFSGGSFGTSPSFSGNNAETSSAFSPPAQAQSPETEMADDTDTMAAAPAFGGLSLDGSSDMDASSTSSAKPVGGGMFASSVTPVSSSSAFNTTANSSGEGAFKPKPSTAFGAFGGMSADSPFAKKSPSTPAPTTFGFASSPAVKPATPTAVSATPAFGQTSKPTFGQSSFGAKPAFGQTSQPAFGQSGFATPSATTGGFGAFANQPPATFTAASKTGGNTGGFGAFASQGPSAFTSNPNKDTPSPAFGSNSSSPVFGKTTESEASIPAIKVEQREEKMPESPPATPPETPSKPEPVKLETSTPSASPFGDSGKASPFGNSAVPQTPGKLSDSTIPSASPFGSLGTASPFGGLKTPATPDSKVESSTPSASPFGTLGQASPFGGSKTPATPEPTTPSTSPFGTLGSSSPFGSSSTSTGGAFGNLKTSTTPGFKPATGFGAFGSVAATPSDSPFMKAASSTPSTTPKVSAFGDLSSLSTKTPTPAGGVKFGSASTMGASNKLAAAVPASTTPSASPAFGGFGAFSGASSPFSAFAAGKDKVLKVEKDQETGKAAEKHVPAEEKSKGRSSKLQHAIQGSSHSAGSGDNSKTEKDSENTASVFTRPPPAERTPTPPGDENTVKGDPLGESTGSFVDVQKPRSVEGNDDDDADADADDASSAEVPSSDGEPREDEDDVSDFLSDEEEEAEAEAESEEDDEEEDDDENEDDDDDEDGALPPIEEEPEEAVTPPGSPAKSPTPSSSQATLGVYSRPPSTRPIRSSPLASAPVLPLPAETSPQVFKARPASPKTPFGVLPPLQVKAKTPEPTSSTNSPTSARPKTPPLLSMMSGPIKPKSVPPPASSLKPEELRGMFDDSLKNFAKELSEITLPDGSKFVPPDMPSLGVSKPPQGPPTSKPPSPFNLAPPTPSPPAAPIAQPQPTTGGPNKGFSSSKPVGNFGASPVSSSSSSSFFPVSPSPIAPLNPSSASTPNTAPFALPKPTGLPSPQSIFGKPVLAPSPAQPNLRPPQTPMQPPVPAPAPATSLASQQPQPTPPAAAARSIFPWDTETNVSAETTMQDRCTRLVDQMNGEFKDLRTLAELLKKRREELSRSKFVRRPDSEQLFNPTAWSLPDVQAHMPTLMNEFFGAQVTTLQEQTGSMKEKLRELKSGLLRATTRKEEIERFSKAKNDADFEKMMKSRTLRPEQTEKQTKLRRDIRALSSRVSELEGQLKSSKKLVNRKVGIKAPSLDSANRAMRNIDRAIQDQGETIAGLTSRLKKIELSNTSVPNNSLTRRDPRLPELSQSSRTTIPDVAVTTAAALNAERSAAKLKKALLGMRGDKPILNIKATGGAPRNLLTTSRGPEPLGDGGEDWASPAAADPFELPKEDVFKPGAAMTGSSQTARGKPAKTHRAPAPTAPKANAVFHSNVSVTSAKPSPPPKEFSWGPLPDFQAKSSPPRSGVPFVSFGSVKK